MASESDIDARLETLRQRRAAGLVTQAEFETAAATILAEQAAGRAARPAINDKDGNILTPAPGNYLGWMFLPLYRYADFSGRSSRKEFWMFQLFMALFVAAAMLLFVRNVYSESGPSSLTLLLGVPLFVVVIALIIPTFAVQARRFHDLNLSGWLILINLVPYIGSLAVWAMMLLKGTAGDNRYGADPTVR